MNEQTPNTPEYHIKRFAHELYMRFNNLGIPHPKAQNAAVTCVLTMVDQYLKLAKRYSFSPEDKQEAKKNFDTLVKNINDYFAGRNYVEVSIEEIAKLKGCSKTSIAIDYFTSDQYTKVTIDEIAEMKGCKKDQILIIY